MKPLKPITVEFLPVVQEKLIKDGLLIFPELETTKLHMDGSMQDFLNMLLQQYAIEKLTLVPANKSDAALREYYDNDLVLRVQAELLSYLLEINDYNRAAEQNAQTNQ